MERGRISGAGRAREVIRRGSASVQIHDSLRARIIALELVPGEALSRAEIAADYGVSQTPVRDAMMKLEEEGLLTIFPQSRTEVSRIDVTHAKETQFLRLSMEVEIARRLSAGDPGLLDPARRLLARQRAAAEVDDLEAFSQLDRAFHAALFEAAGVAPLWDLVTERSGHIDRLRNMNLPDPGKAAEILNCHDSILTAIAEGDAAGAEAEVRRHLSGTLRQLDQIMARQPAFF